MEEEILLTPTDIKKRAIKGVIALTGRTFILQIISLLATFLLTVFLDPKEYGIFYLVSAVINFFVYFSDVGLAAALIQKKEKLTNEDLRTTFTVQQALVLFLILIILLGTPLISGWYKLNQQSIYLLWALAFSLFTASLKTIPSILLERKLEFNKLIIPQIAEALSFYLIAVYFAWKGYGITSFTLAVVVRSLVGLILMYMIQPWLPSFAFSKHSLSSLLKVGLPFQGSTFLALFKDDGMILVLGSILGTQSVGLLGWAQKWASAPLRFFMDQVIKVTFPAYARMQDDKEELSKAVSKSIFFICFIVFPALVVLIICAPLLTQIIPKYAKWQPALLALSLISINSAFAAVTTPLTNLLNAIGKVHVTFKLMVMWTVLTWFLVPALAYLYGVNGAAIGYSLIGLSSVIAIGVAAKYVTIDFIGSVFKPLLVSLVMGLVVFLVKIFIPASLISLIALILLGMGSYLLIYLLVFKESILGDIKKIISLYKANKNEII